MRLTAAQRREQLAEVAARRFQEIGFHRVTLAEVAAEAGVTAPALYRHFRNKQGLLAGAISTGLDAVEQTLERMSDNSLEEIVTAVAQLMRDRDYLWPLVQREARFLVPELRAQTSRQIDRVISTFTEKLRERRPGLSLEDSRMLVTAATSALSAPALPHSVPRTFAGGEVAAAANAILLTNLPENGPVADPEPATGADETGSRQAELLDSAITLFAERGYGAVSLDDIGAAIGIAGPSIYHHFETKADLLGAAFERAVDRLGQERAQHPLAAEDRLEQRVGQYIDFCLRNRKLVGLYVSETLHLPDEAANRIRKILREHVSEWTTVLEREADGLDPRAARVRASVALTVIDDLVRLGPFHRRPLIGAELRALALAILGPQRTSAPT
ncbi:TetR/AcrR family transcriptional regulator [Amycolatopsis sp. NPDC049691]|uniref:TetR/AcrR family transcriptional regulator n=1 Tax=Amycolatopsis sp. NPDC049691 TaxID=3155155 RepID=UPI00344A2767